MIMSNYSDLGTKAQSYLAGNLLSDAQHVPQAVAAKEIYLDYRDALPHSVKDLRLPDFWLFDDSQCLMERYNSRGVWLGSDILLSGEGTERLRIVRDELQRISFSFEIDSSIRWQETRFAASLQDHI